MCAKICLKNTPLFTSIQRFPWTSYCFTLVRVWQVHSHRVSSTPAYQAGSPGYVTHYVNFTKPAILARPGTNAEARQGAQPGTNGETS